MPKKRVFDPILLTTVILLVTFGIAMVYSSSAAIAQARYSDPYHFLKRQTVFALIGSIFMIMMMKIDYRSLRKFTYPALAISFILLIAVWVPHIGKKIGNVNRWIRIGHLSFQSAEFVKLSMVLYLAHSFVKKRESIKSFSDGFMPNMIIAGLYFILILAQPDMGTALLILIVTFISMYAAGVRIRYLIGSIICIIPFIYLAIFNVDYRRRRITAFLDPWSDPTDSGFQIIQSLISFGRGNIFGMGIGEGKQKLFYLPEPHNDFIFSVIGEETGIVGTITLIIIFMVFVWRGLRVSLRSHDMYGTYLSLIIVLTIGIQILINISVTIGLLPTKGIPLPLISLGGTSLIIYMTMIGILLNISEHTS